MEWLLGWCDVAMGYQPAQVDLLGACGAGALFGSRRSRGWHALGRSLRGRSTLFGGRRSRSWRALARGRRSRGRRALAGGLRGRSAFSGAGGAGAGSLLVGACGAVRLLAGAWAVCAGADDVEAPARNAAPTHPNIRLQLMDSVLPNVAPSDHTEQPGRGTRTHLRPSGDGIITRHRMRSLRILRNFRRMHELFGLAKFAGI